MDPPIPWKDWSDLFQLAAMAKENIDKENLLIPTERYHQQSPLLEKLPDSEPETQEVSRLDRNLREQERFDDEESASLKPETKRFNGMRIEEADKKLQSILYLALGNEGEKIFGLQFS